MEWRHTFLRTFGPGLMGGVTFARWMSLLCHHRFAVVPSCFPRALAISFQSLQNSVLAWHENRRFGSLVKNVVVEPPLFLLGHWRNGTTLLHYLVTVDTRFAYPNMCQSFFPHAVLTAESFQSRMVAFFLPKRRPMDNVEWTMRSPQEDEFALCISTFKSPCMGWVWPNHRELYDKYLTFREVSEREINEWREAFMLLVQKLTWKYRCPLVLKSPPHTCRIKLLLEMFPQAKFVHIHRNPYAVFASSRRTFSVNFDLHRLQRARLSDLDDWILRQYRQMYDVFFEERSLIPQGRFYEVCYEELEQDPVGQVKRIYEALDLADFAHTEPALRRYVNSIAGYQKNELADLSADLRNRIADQWRPCFREWGYPV